METWQWSKQYPPETLCNGHLFLICILWLIWATLLSLNVLNRGHSGISSDISCLGGLFYLQRGRKSRKQKNTFFLSSLESTWKSGALCLKLAFSSVIHFDDVQMKNYKDMCHSPNMHAPNRKLKSVIYLISFPTHTHIVFPTIREKFESEVKGPRFAKLKNWHHGLSAQILNVQE